MSDESLFEMRYMDLESVEDDGDSTISAPLRGTLALMLSLIAFAAALFHMHDVNSGVYELVPLRYRNILSMGCIAVPVFDGAILMLLVLIVTGNTGNIGREALNLLLFSINTVLFANIPISLLKSEERYGALIPVLMLMMMVLCPVFLLIRNSNPVRFVLPPYIYLMSGHAWQYTLAGLVMAVALGALDFLLSKVFSVGCSLTPRCSSSWTAWSTSVESAAFPILSRFSSNFFPSLPMVSSWPFRSAISLTHS